MTWFCDRLRDLTLLLDAIEGLQTREGMFKRVSRLRDSGRFAKTTTASMILTFNAFRNRVVKDLDALKAEEWKAAQALWRAINSSLN